MADILTNAQAQATIAGTNLYTASSETLTLVGIRAANNDGSAEHTFHIELNGFLITGLETPLPIGSAFEAAPGSKVVVKDTDILTAYSDADNVVDITLSFLQQT